MHVVNQPLVLNSFVSAANAPQAPTIVPSSAEKTVCVGYIGITFAGGVPATPLAVTLSDGTTTFTIPVPAAGLILALAHALRFKKNGTLTVTIPAGGAAITSELDIGTYQDSVP